MSILDEDQEIVSDCSLFITGKTELTTAAHCITSLKYNNSPPKIECGEEKKSVTPILVEIAKDYSSALNDKALIKLKEPIGLPNLPIISNQNKNLFYTITADGEEVLRDDIVCKSAGFGMNRKDSTLSGKFRL